MDRYGVLARQCQMCTTAINILEMDLTVTQVFCDVAYAWTGTNKYPYQATDHIC